MGQQGIHCLLVLGGKFLQTLINGRGELCIGRMVARTQALLLHEPPHPLDQIQVRRVRGQIQQVNPQLLRQPRHQRALLVAGIVQNHRDRFPHAGLGDGPQQGTHGLGIDVTVVGHPKQAMTHGMQRPQHVVTLASGRRTHAPTPPTPDPTQEGGKHEVGRIHEVDLAAARARLGQHRVQLFVPERLLRPRVFLRSNLRRHRDGRHLAGCGSQAVQEAPDLGQATTQARALLDDLLGVADSPGRVFPKILLQGGAVVVQSGTRPAPGAAVDLLQAALEELGEVALDGTARNAGEGGEAFVGKAVMLQPQHLALALDAGIGMVVTVVGDGTQFLVGEGNRTHDPPPT
jgi:hypothetical protein